MMGQDQAFTDLHASQYVKTAAGPLAKTTVNSPLLKMYKETDKLMATLPKHELQKGVERPRFTWQDIEREVKKAEEAKSLAEDECRPAEGEVILDKIRTLISTTGVRISPNDDDV